MKKLLVTLLAIVGLSTTFTPLAQASYKNDVNSLQVFQEMGSENNETLMRNFHLVTGATPVWANIPNHPSSAQFNWIVVHLQPGDQFFLHNMYVHNNELWVSGVLSSPRFGSIHGGWFLATALF